MMPEAQPREGQWGNLLCKQTTVDEKQLHWEKKGQTVSSKFVNQERQEVKLFCSFFRGNKMSSPVLSLWKICRNSSDPHWTNLNFSASFEDLLRSLLVFPRINTAVEPYLEIAPLTDVFHTSAVVHIIMCTDMQVKSQNNVKLPAESSYWRLPVNWTGPC